MNSPSDRRSCSSIDVIIVTWNSGRHLRDCLTSLASAVAGLDVGVFIVDNGSVDRALEFVESHKDISIPLRIIRNSTNTGFAAACNRAALRSTAEFLLLLNPDTKVSPESVIRSLSFIQQPGKIHIGVVGIRLIDDHEKTWRSCARLPSARDFISTSVGFDRLFPRLLPSYVMKEWDHTENRDVDHVTGAFFLVRTELFRQMNGFDESFFVYLEDLDFCCRIKQKGYAVYYLADAYAYHTGGGSSEQAKSRRLSYALRSKMQYAWKHFTWWQAVPVVAVVMLVEPLVRVGFALSTGSVRSAVETAVGYAMLVRDLCVGRRRAWMG